ncbi:MAG: cytochrome c biogenesis protein ResB [Syntrophorhabdaceae bacterium]|nr:cytochrome c biogenesis protein ResB [Syntrophorhabdaceae bacterium]
MFILSFIALTSILGTIIKQNAPVEEYLTYSETVLKIIDFFQLYDIYHAPWFIGAIVFFAINLTVCTLTRFLKKWKEVSRNNIPDENTLYNMKLNFTLKKEKEDDAISIINKKFKKKVYEGEDGIIFEKGSFNRYGVFLIHMSILIILIGSLVGLIWGYKGFVVLSKGDLREYFFLRGKEAKEVPFGFALRCKDFNVSFYPNGAPKDYVTRLEIIENNKVLFEREIRVNNPLNYKGLNIYQSSYGTTPAFVFKIDHREVVLKEYDEYEIEGFIMVPVRFEKAIHNFGPGVQVAFLEDGEPKTTWFLRDIPKMKERELEGKRVILEDIREELWTGLEVTRDPGTGIVWTGFGLMLIGLYINFFVVAGRLYIKRSNDVIIVAASGIKHHEKIQIEFEKIKRSLNGTDPS